MKTQEQLDEYRGSVKRRPEQANPQYTLYWLGMVVIMVLICIALAGSILKQGTNAATNAYDKSKEDAASKAYDLFYQDAYDRAKKKYLVTNQATISLNGIKEESKLEVLRVQNVVYEIANNDMTERKGVVEKTTKAVLDVLGKEPEAWLEVPGYGVFTVNMQLAEFIVDNANHYVLVRVPKPELGTTQIIPADIKRLYLQNGGWFRNSVEDGEKVIRGSIQDAELRMKQDIENNQEFYKRAEDSSKTILENLVRKMNMDIRDLKVEVEFIG